MFFFFILFVLYFLLVFIYLFFRIVGTGGIGKTALAKEVYRQLQGHAQFNCGDFVYLGRNPSVKAILISILKQVMPEWQWHYEKDLWSGDNYDDMRAWDEKKVVAKLWAFLKIKR